jgi:hypothetical protein
MVVAIIDKDRRTSVISLGLRVVNLRYSDRWRLEWARLFEMELWGVPAVDNWSRGRRCASLYKSWVLIASIAGVMIVIGVYGMVGFAVDLGMRVLVPSLPRRRLAL